MVVDVLSVDETAGARRQNQWPLTCRQLSYIAHYFVMRLTVYVL